jgi:hypothetical protein
MELGFFLEKNMTLEKLTALTLTFALLVACFVIGSAAQRAADDERRLQQHKQTIARAQLRDVCRNAWPLDGERYYECIDSGLKRQ